MNVTDIVPSDELVIDVCRRVLKLFVAPLPQVATFALIESEFGAPLFLPPQDVCLIKADLDHYYGEHLDDTITNVFVKVLSVIMSLNGHAHYSQNLGYLLKCIEIS
jgi:hypothetical protein